MNFPTILLRTPFFPWQKHSNLQHVPVPNHTWSMSACPNVQVSFVDQSLITFSFDSIPALDKAITGHSHDEVGIRWKHGKLQWHATSTTTWEGTETSGHVAIWRHFGGFLFSFLWWFGDDVCRCRLGRWFMIWDWEDRPNGNAGWVSLDNLGKCIGVMEGWEDMRGSAKKGPCGQTVLWLQDPIYGNGPPNATWNKGWRSLNIFKIILYRNLVSCPVQTPCHTTI